MTNEQMRSALMFNTKYSCSQKWKDKVRRMSPSQVLAIYQRLSKKGEILSKST